MVKPVTYRPANRTDIGALHALIERAYRGDAARRGWTHEADLLGGQRTDAVQLGALLDDAREHIVIAERAGALCGCVNVSDRGFGTRGELAYLGLLSVDSELQRAGLGSALLVEAERIAAAFGAATIEMTVIRQRPELIAYYARRGYHPTGETRPFPVGDPRFGVAKTSDLVFVVLARSLVACAPPPIFESNGDAS